MDRPAKLHQDSGAYCEICLEFNGERTHVYGFCTDCKEYLCKSCCEYHCRPKPSRDHQLVYKTDMPDPDHAVKTLSLSGYQCPKMCETHPDMPVLLYCDAHMKQICTLCASIMHVSCNTRAINSTETRFLSNLKVERTFSEIDQILTTCKTNTETAENLSLKNERQMFDTIEGVTKLTEMLQEELGSAMNRVILKIKDCHRENKELINANKEANEKAAKKASDLKKHLQSFVEEKRYSHLYRGIQNSDDILKKIKAMIKSAETESKYKEIICHVDKRLYELIENPELFVLVTGQNNANMYQLYTDLLVPSEYVEGRIPDKVTQGDSTKRNNTGAYDYVYTYMLSKRKS
ncbi:E3 ubiquitin-protein ligase TRIM33-like [Ruditapes philippinarum]|uniref:E3 ubiquitin-protein ligase TRIM33-like n=1 Tax=Ruditapes philippinarum TaxID=129788 RepID=UPI00295AC689|nr:E3 ubiquitin-protein ligase TRIM33-like [Ruditapes philippinarum]XP_060575628.1 E3 ubiquitin-protein ligase TRIM33-like [Ruditapes philippinarum]